MITEQENTRISKFLSLVLRHQPETLGITLNENGWTDVEILIQKMSKRGYAVTTEILIHVVETNDKKRFAFNEDKSMIRASQGHSIDIDLGYKSQIPPEILYHGTADVNTESILKKGIEKRNRHHVHLSIDIETATKVGKRHGMPVLFEVAAYRMHKDGYKFYVSDNNVWLTDYVPEGYLKLIV